MKIVYLLATSMISGGGKVVFYSLFPIRYSPLPTKSGM